MGIIQTRKRVLSSAIRWSVLSLTLSTLAACSSLKPIQHSEQLKFTMEGRMAVDMPRSPEKNSSGKIRWDEYPSATDITLSSPFGNAVAMIHLTPKQATYKGSDGSMVTEDTPEELFYRLFGMDMPIANLRDWIGTPDRPLNKFRNVDGWRVVVTDTFTNPNLAKRVEVSREQPQPITLTLAVTYRSDAQESNTSGAPDTTQEVDLDKLLPKP